jgi:branched-chain amino acid transport system ATP-binding protein
MAEPEVLLQTENLSKRFGGLVAVRDVSLEVATGGIHAVIGPNGAGKSTLLDMLSGDLKPSSGNIRFGGREIAGWSAHRIARLGVGRSYQRTNIFPSFTAFENCRLAAQARRATSMRFFRAASSYPGLREDAEEALRMVRLEERATDAAAP